MGVASAHSPFFPLQNQNSESERFRSEKTWLHYQGTTTYLKWLLPRYF